MKDKAERDKLVRLNDIVESVDLIEKYIDGLTQEEFFSSSEKQDSVIRRLEIIGEAVRSLPSEYKAQYPDIAWKHAAGMRNILAHEYFNVDVNITWDALKNDLPKFKLSIQQLIQG